MEMQQWLIKELSALPGKWAATALTAEARRGRPGLIDDARKWLRSLATGFVCSHADSLLEVAEKFHKAKNNDETTTSTAWQLPISIVQLLQANGI